MISFRENHPKLKNWCFVLTVIVIVVTSIIGLLEGTLLVNHDIQKIDDYMYSIQCDNYNYEIVDTVLSLGTIKPGGCSAVRSGSIAGRNFDWYLDDDAEFVVFTPGDDERYATMGVAALTGIDNSDVEDGDYSVLYEFLPFYTVDGINEKGLFVSVNIVPAGDAGLTSGTNPGKEKLANVIMARYLLDYAATTEEAVALLSERDIYAYEEEDGPFEVHLMVCDREKSIAIEFIDNKLQVCEDCDVMTNFYMCLEDYTEHAMGIERYDILKANYEGSDTVEGMLELLKMVEYSKYYDTDTAPRWYSESYGEMIASDGEVFGISSDISKFEPIFLAESEAYENAQRDGTFWETTHCSVYDLENLTLSMYVQEGDQVHTLELEPMTAYERRAQDNRKTREIIIPMEIVCAVMLLVVLYGMLFENELKDHKSTTFIITLICALVAIFADICSWNYDGLVCKVGIQAVSCYLAMIMSEIIAVSFLWYEYDLVREKRERGRRLAIATSTANGIAIVIMTIGIPLGKTFYFVDGVYFVEDWYYISYGMAFANILVIVAYTFACRKILGKHDARSIMIYVLIPLFTTVLEIFNPTLELAYVSISIAIVIIYILLQSGKVSALHMRHMLLQEISYADALTGLPNRRAYDETLAEENRSRIGVIFCDINGLKYTNDNLGHKAGDALIVRFAEILKDHFGCDKIFRISGDEFVILCPDTEELTFAEVVKKLKDDIFTCGEIASAGSFYGEEGSVLEFIANAEKDMYKDKAEFYKRNPKYDRRKA